MQDGSSGDVSLTLVRTDPPLATFLARARKAGVRIGNLNPYANPFVPRSRLSKCFDQLVLAVEYRNELVVMRKRNVLWLYCNLDIAPVAEAAVAANAALPC